MASNMEIVRRLSSFQLLRRRTGDCHPTAAALSLAGFCLNSSGEIRCDRCELKIEGVESDLSGAIHLCRHHTNEFPRCAVARECLELSGEVFPRSAGDSETGTCLFDNMAIQKASVSSACDSALGYSWCSAYSGCPEPSVSRDVPDSIDMDAHRVCNEILDLREESDGLTRKRFCRRCQQMNVVILLTCRHAVSCDRCIPERIPCSVCGKIYHLMTWMNNPND